MTQTDPDKTAGVIAPPPLIALAAILLALAVHWLWPTALLVGLPGSVRLGLGAGLLAIGAQAGLRAILSFRAVGTHVEPWKPSSALALSGIYSRTRNPMYQGILLILAGLALVWPLDALLVLVPVVAAILHFGVVRREEAYLSARFGDPYRAYLGQVPRYGLPF
jgi:protein-S-isoprenylcysteine O-methyltransferase Ste14